MRPPAAAAATIPAANMINCAAAAKNFTSLSAQMRMQRHPVHFLELVDVR